MSDDLSNAPAPVRRRTVHITEDWAATVVGLLLVVFFLSGILPTGLVPR